MIRGLLLDLDGTLVDSNWIWKNIGWDFLVAQGCTPEEGLLQKFEEMSFTQSAQYMIERYGLSMDVPQVIATVTAMAEEAYRTKVKAKPGAMKLLEKAREAGYVMGVDTALDQRVARELLERLGMLEYVQKVMTCETLGLPKTEPEFYRRAAKELGLAPKETVVFEDAPHGLRTAKQAGFFTVGVEDPWGAAHREEAVLNSDRFVSSLEELTQGDTLLLPGME